MPSASKYMMFGEHFAREFVLEHSDIISKDSLGLYRINTFSSDKLDDSFNRDNPSQINFIIKNRQDVVLKKNINKLQERIGHKVAYIEYAFSTITQIDGGEISVKEIQPEKIITSRQGNGLLKYHKLSTSSILDSLYLNPVIPEDKESWAINNKLFSIFPAPLGNNSNLIVISGEMIWSGWVSLSSVLKLLERSKLNRELIIIDNWGYLQQRLSMDYNNITKDNSSLRDNLENNTMSIFVETSKKVKEYKDQIDINSKSLKIGLFANSSYSRTMQNGFEHKPDYLYFPKEAKKSTILDIPLGIQSTSVKSLQEVFLGKNQIHLNLPYETLIQKSIGEEVEYGEDIGQYPQSEFFLLALKFSNRFNQSVKNWQLMNKGDVVGEKKVLKNLLREKVLAPVKGRIDNRYLPWGLLRFSSVKTMSTFKAPFEGKLLGMKKVNNINEINIHAECFTVPLTYSKGPEVDGIIVSIADFKTEMEGEKIVLLKRSDLGQINKEEIVKYNIIGFILLDADYQLVKEFSKDYLHNSKNINLSLIHPLSSNSLSCITDILYLMSGRRAVIREKKIYIVIDKRSKKEIYLRMNSGKESSQGINLKKGDYVYYLNYKHNNMYARIEKLKPDNVLLVADDEVIQAKAINILKYSTSEINA